MGLYEAIPDGDARHAVIVIQEVFGVNEHIQDVTRRFAAAGFRAVAPAVFHRTGSATHDDYSNIDMAWIGAQMQGLTDEALLHDLDATREFLHGNGYSDSAIGIVGFCFGGRVAFLAAVSRPFGAAVTYYGGGIVDGRPEMGWPSLAPAIPGMQAHWLGLFGDLDQGIPVEEVERLRAAVAAAPVDTEIVRYADADHGFHCDARGSYHAASAADGWARCLDWMGRHLS
jgi:carboxymethylenebutenolidase